MRQDKKDISKIEEIEVNRQATATNVVHHEKKDHFGVAKKIDIVPQKDKAALSWHFIKALLPLSLITHHRPVSFFMSVYFNVNLILICLT